MEFFWEGNVKELPKTRGPKRKEQEVEEKEGKEQGRKMDEKKRK